MDRQTAAGERWRAPTASGSPCSSSPQILEGSSFGNMVARPLPLSLPRSLSWERLGADRRAAGVSQGRSTPSHLSETRGPFSTGICSLLQEASPDASSSTSVNLLSSGRTATSSRPCRSPLELSTCSLGVCWLSSWNAPSSPQKHDSNASSSKKPSRISLIGLDSQPLSLLFKLLRSLCALHAEPIGLRPRGSPGDSVRRPPLVSLPPAWVPRGGAVLAPRQPTASADRCLLRRVINARIS